MIRWMPPRRSREPFRPSVVTAILGALACAVGMIGLLVR